MGQIRQSTHFELQQRFFRAMLRFRKTEDGVALVEFALILPLMLIFFAVTIESARMMRSYQAVTSGVRDATRYLARVAPLDLCVTGGSVAGYTTDLTTIVSQRITGGSVLPTMVTVTSVTPSITCVSGTFRVSPAPIVQVSAQVQIVFPFAAMFTLFGGNLGTVTTTVSDQNKVFGT